MTPELDSPPPGWLRVPEEKQPKPTAWPPVLALGITFIFWGLISTLIITGVGAFVFVVALLGWIGNIRHERQS